MDLRLQASSYEPQTHVLNISIPWFTWEGAIVNWEFATFVFREACPPILYKFSLVSLYVELFLHFLGMCETTIISYGDIMCLRCSGAQLESVKQNLEARFSGFSSVFCATCARC